MISHNANFSNGKTISANFKKVKPFAWIMIHVQIESKNVQTFSGFSSTKESAIRESKSKHGISAKRELMFSEVVETITT